MKKIFFFFIALILLIVFGIAYTGLIRIPILSDILGTHDPIDLGIETDDELFLTALDKYGIFIEGNPNEFCVTCEAQYSEYKQTDISLTSAELSSIIQATNYQTGPLQDIQIKLGDNNSGELAAMIDLSPYGYDYQGPVYAAGSITVENNRVSVDLSKAKLGKIPAPTKYLDQGASGLEALVNSALANMNDLDVDSFSVENGQLNVQGNLPTHYSASK